MPICPCCTHDVNDPALKSFDTTHTCSACHKVYCDFCGFYAPVTGAGGLRTLAACPMCVKVKDVFESTSSGIRAKCQIIITGAAGSQAQVSPGALICSASPLAGVTGKWVMEHMEDGVPSSWRVTHF